MTGASGSAVDVEVVVSGEQADELADQGVELEPKQIDGETAAELSTARLADGTTVFRRTAAPAASRRSTNRSPPPIPTSPSWSSSARRCKGQDIVALKVTKNAQQTADGRRPATLFSAAQHAREWITPEMVRRLTHHVVDGYGSDPAMTDLVKKTELWFVPVANPDGYDLTFEPGQRLWRKNLPTTTATG